MTRNEAFALGEYICDIPDDKTYRDVLENIEDYDIWQPFEDYSYDDVVDLIEAMRCHLDGWYPEGKKED
jgi:hypothetical protein